MATATQEETALAPRNGDAQPPVKKEREIIPIHLTDQDAAIMNWIDQGRFDHIQRIAKVFASSNLAPEQYRGKVPDCIIGVQMAFRLNVEPFMFLQNTYVVHGKPGVEAKLAIALMNQRGPFSGPVQWRFSRDCRACKGMGWTEQEDNCSKCGGTGQVRIAKIPSLDAMSDDITCTCYATHRQTGDVCEAPVSWRMVKDEGWLTKNGSKWRTMPDQMFRYRSATFLARLFCPEVLMGMQTAEELEDVGRTITVERAAPPPADPRAFEFEFDDVQPAAQTSDVATEAKLEPAPEPEPEVEKAPPPRRRRKPAEEEPAAEANPEPDAEPEKKPSAEPAPSAPAEQAQAKAPSDNDLPADEPKPVDASKKIKIWCNAAPPDDWQERLTAAGFRASGTKTTWIAMHSEAAYKLAGEAADERWCDETRYA